MKVKRYEMTDNNLNLIIDLSKEEKELLNQRYKWKIKKDPKQEFKEGENHIYGLFVTKYKNKIEEIIKKSNSYLSYVSLMEYVLTI